MKVKECYEALNGDYESMISRFSTEDIVSKFLKLFLNDKSFENLKAALKEKDYKEAFREGHTLKGVCQNLSLDALSEVSSDITEALRNENNILEEDALAAMFEKVEEEYNKTITAIEKFID